MIIGFQVSRAIGVAAELGIADLLAEGSLSVEQLAALTNTRAPLLYRMLRALASRGIFAELEDGRFAMTPLADRLRSSAPGGSVRAYAVFAGQAFAQRPWEQMLATLRTGQPGFDQVYGAPLFDYLATDVTAGEIFNDAMTSNSSREAEAVIAAYDFTGLRSIVDVAGGHGRLIATVLTANPDAHGVLFDLPHVIAGARPVVHTGSLADRCRLVEGDMFAAVPAGGDAYLLKRTLHDWDDDRARAILQNCARAGKPGARVLIIEMVVPPGNEPHQAKLYDLMMMVMLGGRERTRHEFADLLAGAGFRLVQIVDTNTPLSVIEATLR
jgi:hypothetical protein